MVFVELRRLEQPSQYLEHMQVMLAHQCIFPIQRRIHCLSWRKLQLNQVELKAFSHLRFYPNFHPPIVLIALAIWTTLLGLHVNPHDQHMPSGEYLEPFASCKVSSWLMNGSKNACIGTSRRPWPFPATEDAQGSPESLSPLGHTKPVCADHLILLETTHATCRDTQSIGDWNFIIFLLFRNWNCSFLLNFVLYSRLCSLLSIFKAAATTYMYCNYVQYFFTCFICLFEISLSL